MKLYGERIKLVLNHPQKKWMQNNQRAGSDTGSKKKIGE